MRFLSRPIIPALCLAALTACSAVNPAAVMQMRKLDPFTTDPGLIRAYVAVTGGHQLPPGSVTLTVSAENETLNEAISHSFVLAEQAGPEGGVVFALTQEDGDDLRALQAKAADWKLAAPGKSHGAYSLEVSPCPLPSGLLMGDEVTLSLSMDGGATKTPVITGLPVEKLLREVEKTLEDEGAEITESERQEINECLSAIGK